MLYFCFFYCFVYAALLMYFISAVVILLASLALIVHVSLPYNKTGKASVLYSFTLVFLLRTDKYTYTQLSATTVFNMEYYITLTHFRYILKFFSLDRGRYHKTILMYDIWKVRIAFPKISNPPFVVLAQNSCQRTSFSLCVFPLEETPYYADVSATNRSPWKWKASAQFSNLTSLLLDSDILYYILAFLSLRRHAFPILWLHI